MINKTVMIVFCLALGSTALSYVKDPRAPAEVEPIEPYPWLPPEPPVYIPLPVPVVVPAPVVVSSEDYVAPGTVSYQEFGIGPLVTWRINAVEQSDRNIVKSFIDELYRRWEDVNNYKEFYNGRGLEECVNRNTELDIASYMPGIPYDGRKMIDDMGLYFFRTGLIMAPHIVTVNLDDDPGFCSIPDWAGCAEPNTWPDMTLIKETPFLPGLSHSPKFVITLRTSAIRSTQNKTRGWAGVILHEVLHNFGWRHSSYNGNVQIVAMEKCFGDLDYKYRK